MSLRITDVSYAYRAKSALSKVSFDVPGGRFCALLGPNGAGKSTLFALLTNLFSTRMGTIEIDGINLTERPRAALARIGVVFQQTTLDLDLTVAQNMRYFAALQGLSGRAAHQRIDYVTDLLNIRDRMGETVRTLNGGHKRRTEIARCLIHDPQVLLLDEPTVGLDPKSRMAITHDVHALCHDHGKTVLWATHLADEIYDDDDIVILHRGQAVAKGLVQTIRKNQSLTRVFLHMTADYP